MLILYSTRHDLRDPIHRIKIDESLIHSAIEEVPRGRKSIGSIDNFGVTLPDGCTHSVPVAWLVRIRRVRFSLRTTVAIHHVGLDEALGWDDGVTSRSCRTPVTFQVGCAPGSGELNGLSRELFELLGCRLEHSKRANNYMPVMYNRPKTSVKFRSFQSNHGVSPCLQLKNNNIRFTPLSQTQDVRLDASTGILHKITTTASNRWMFHNTSRVSAPALASECGGQETVDYEFKIAQAISNQKTNIMKSPVESSLPA